MAIHLAVDEGGSTIRVLAYDDDFMPLLTARSGSIRVVSTTIELIDAHLNDLMIQLAPLRGQHLGRVSGVLSTTFLERLKEICSWEELRFLGESTISLAAAGLFGDGILALSGTGCTIFAHKDGKITTLGGYGGVVYDKGSGYYVGREAFEAAIHSYAGMGEKTLLEPLICDHFGELDLNDAIFSIYNCTDHSPIAAVASCAPLVSLAAYRGDEIARDILIRAGVSVGSQTVALHRMAGMDPHCAVTISGGNFRGHPLFYNTFKKTLLSALPGIALITPKVAPIIGAVYLHARDRFGGEYFSQKQPLEEVYGEYKFEIRELIGSEETP